jgi:TonB family protein
MEPAGLDELPEITEKPSPGYTEAARVQKIEGVIRVRALFRADGRIQVLAILNRLGYGLDDLAVDAVKRVRFKPAKHNGQEVDQPAVLEVEFRLAE